MAKRVTRFTLVAMATLLSGWVFGKDENPALMACPDCGRQVSRRALMCPACGCKGAVIEAVAKELALKPKPKEPDRFLRANFGDRIEVAKPVMMDGQRYAVLDFKKVVGLNTLTFMFASTNTTVAYGKPQLAKAVPVLRFPIDETNLVFTTEIDTNVWETIQPRDLRNREKMTQRLEAYTKGVIK